MITATSEPRSESPVKLLDPAETVARCETLSRDLTETTRQLAEAQAEIARLKAGRASSLVQAVGQRFVDGEGVTVTIVGRGNSPSFPWLGRTQRGSEMDYADDGAAILGRPYPRFNLVGPAADELAEAKKDAERLINELKRAKRERGDQPKPPLYAVKRPIDNSACCDAEAEVNGAISQELDEAIAAHGRRLPFTVGVTLAGESNLAPLRLEGESWGPNGSGYPWEAHLRPAASCWTEKGFLAVYEVESR